ncbi:MAG: hypothetical protein WC823_05775, partial [Parcubacteria group bacterium]
FVSYLILYEINPNLLEIKGICQSGGGATGTSTSTGITTGPSTAATEVSTRAKLISSNNIGINNKACEAGQTSGCTSVGGLRSETVDNLVDLKKAVCPDLSIATSEKCFTVTGGSEGGHSSVTDFTHANGYKVDLAQNTKLDSYIETKYTPAGERKEKNGTTSKLYTDPQGNVYAKEVKPPHWDVCYNCHK